MAEEKPIRHSHNFKDLTGQTFGRLKVNGLSHSFHKKLYWNCICNCGKEKAVDGASLLKGITISCGCYGQEQRIASNVRRLKDLTGQKVGRLSVLTLYGSRKHGNAQWNCSCECGRATIVTSNNLIRGNTTSCGCYRTEISSTGMRARSTTHGMAYTKEHAAWSDAKARCLNPTHQSYANYGGRGIQMCQEWRDSFQAFYDFMGPCPGGLTLERIAVNGNYEPGNCKWATHSEQNRNKRRTLYATHDGKTMCLKDWSDHLGISYVTLLNRYRRGSPPLFAKVQQHRKKLSDNDNS